MMVQSVGGRTSGRTTPQQQELPDLLDENPDYRSVAPPCPVSHRRTSVEWVMFTDEDRPPQQTGILAKTLNGDKKIS